MSTQDTPDMPLSSSLNLTSKSTMQARMVMYQQIRHFFAVREVAEVETPILSPYGSTDVHIDSFVTQWEEAPLYLHTSPEFAMKRLLVAGFGDCFQIAKVFRHEPSSTRHRPEFTLLEWYRLGFSMDDLIAEVATLVKTLFPQWQDLPVEILTYQQVFARIGVNAHGDDLATLQQRAIALCGYTPKLDNSRDQWLDFLLVTAIERDLGQGRQGQGSLTFLTHYPPSMAALAKITSDVDGYAVAERFELYFQGIELANGFCELTDADEQLARFHADNVERRCQGKATVPHDESLIAALRQGMPDCAGVALGLDRLLMLGLGQGSLASVLPEVDFF